MYSYVTPFAILKMYTCSSDLSETRANSEVTLKSAQNATNVNRLLTLKSFDVVRFHVHLAS